MINNSSNESDLSKKRKANDRRSSTTDGAQDGSSCGNKTTQLDRMEEMMMRMEEKLATVSSLESKCEELERKCSSLENMILESTSQLTLASKQIGDKVDSVNEKVERSLKFHEYNKMLINNQGWEYSAPIYPSDDQRFDDYTEEEAEFLTETTEELKEMTIKLRRGEFPSGNQQQIKGIHLEMNEEFPQFDLTVNNDLLPHWHEFANALNQFTPAINLLPDNVESYFTLYFVQLNSDAMLMIKDALIGKPFQSLAFSNNDNEDGVRVGMSVDAILDIVESNKHLRKLQIEDRNQIGTQHIERICSAVRNCHLVKLDLCNSFEPSIADKMLASLLTIDDLKLEELDMSSNDVTSVGGTLLANFLATNPTLKKLDLHWNGLDDSDAALFADALRSNRTLQELVFTNITSIGAESFHTVICDESSLNSVADSNHSCRLVCNLRLGWERENNHSSNTRENRGRKICLLLSSRNRAMSNVQHFGDIDVKLLPNVVESVQKYSKENRHGYGGYVKSLSIVYEIMRRWDKVTPLYKSKT